VTGHHPALRLAPDDELTAEHSGTALRRWSSGEGMTIAAEVIPGDPHVGGDFFLRRRWRERDDGHAIGDVAGTGLSAVHRSAFTRTALASAAPFVDDPYRLVRWVNVALVERVGQRASSSPRRA
jgi:hypothetical protein